LPQKPRVVNIKTKNTAPVHNISPSTSRFSFFSTLNSFIPKEILGVQVDEIKKDLKEGGSQIGLL